MPAGEMAGDSTTQAILEAAPRSALSFSRSCENATAQAEREQNYESSHENAPVPVPT
jgi:hypothetical protein